MSTSRHVAVVGGSLAGLRSAEQLRALGHTGPITVFSAERHLPYNRPPLSKEALGEFEGALDDLAGGVIVTYHRDHRHVGTVAVNVRPVRHRELREAFNVQAVSA